MSSKPNKRAETIWARLWIGGIGDSLVDVDTGKPLINPPITFESEIKALAYIRAENLPIVITQVRYIH